MSMVAKPQRLSLYLRNCSVRGGACASEEELCLHRAQGLLFLAEYVMRNYVQSIMCVRVFGCLRAYLVVYENMQWTHTQPSMHEANACA
jgi:hypothetical protein